MGVLLESQEGIGRIMGVSKRTMTRWMRGGHWLAQCHAEPLARAIHPVDPVLAAEIAAAGETSLVEMGLGPSAAGLDSRTRALVDAVVLSAAEALDASPRLAAPALLAALRRARELGLGLDLVEVALTPPKPERRAAKAG